MPLEPCLDRFFVSLSPLRRVANPVNLQPNGGDVLTLGSLRKACRPGPDLLGDRLAILQQPSIVGFQRDFLTLHILTSCRGAGDAAGVGHDLDHGRLVARRQPAGPSEGAGFPAPAPARQAAGDRRVSRGRRGPAFPGCSAAGSAPKRAGAFFIPAAGDRRA